MYYRLVRKLFQIAAKGMCSECKDFIKEASEILDLGCGSGVVGYEFKKFFKAKITGIDIKDYRVEKMPFQIFDGINIPFPDNYFDCVLIAYVLHHCEQPEELLKEAKRVSKKIIIFEDLPEGVFSKIRCKLHHIIFFGGERGKFNFKTRKEWKGLFKKSGLKIITEKLVSTSLDWFEPVKRTLFGLIKTE